MEYDRPKCSGVNTKDGNIAQDDRKVEVLPFIITLCDRIKDAGCAVIEMTEIALVPQVGPHQQPTGKSQLLLRQVS